MKRAAAVRRQAAAASNNGCIVDHRVELKDGGAPLDRANVWVLCGSCHTRKTLAERAEADAEWHGGRSV